MNQEDTALSAEKSNQEMMHAAEPDAYNVDAIIGDILDARAQGKSDGALLRYDAKGRKDAEKAIFDRMHGVDVDDVEIAKAEDYNQVFDVASGDDAIYNNQWYDYYEPDHDPEWCNAVERGRQRTRIKNRSYFAGHSKNRLHNNPRFPED